MFRNARSFYDQVEKSGQGNAFVEQTAPLKINRHEQPPFRVQPSGQNRAGTASLLLGKPLYQAQIHPGAHFGFYFIDILPARA